MTEEDESKNIKISRKENTNSSDGIDVTNNLTKDVNSIRSKSGSSLEKSTREFMESRLGYDFSNVRIHTDTVAAESARALGAHAYTIKNEIFFENGSYSPNTHTGRHLLAHELVHVIQQNRALNSEVIQRQLHDAPVHSSNSSGIENLVLSGNIPSEKWSDEIEHHNRMRGDFIRANAIRSCRMQGAGACLRLLTNTEMWALFNLAKESKGDRKAIEAGLAGAAPLLAPPLNTPVPVRPFPPLRLVPPLEPVPPTLEPVPLGPGIVPYIAAGVVIVLLLSAAKNLWDLSRFQSELRYQGFIILEAPLALCIGGCHMPSQDHSELRPAVSGSLMDSKDFDMLLKAKKARADAPAAVRAPSSKSVNSCMEEHPSAMICDEPRDLQEYVVNVFLNGQQWRFGKFEVRKIALSEGEISDCNYGPAVYYYHVTDKKTGNKISIFGCLCCNKDGSSGVNWRGHESAYQGKRNY